MAGLLVSVEGLSWSAAWWLFDWALGTIATQVADTELAAKLREIEDNNRGWFSLQQCTASEREQILEAICTSLVPTAEREDTSPNDALTPVGRSPDRRQATLLDAVGPLPTQYQSPQPWLSPLGTVERLFAVPVPKCGRRRRQPVGVRRWFPETRAPG